MLNEEKLDFTKGIFPDLFNDYAARLFESPEDTKKRYESILAFAKNCVPKLNNCSKIGFSVDYLNVIETVILSCLLKRSNPETQIIWGGPAITQSCEAFKLMLTKVCDGLVVGEGEQPALDFALGKNLNDVKGVISLKKGTKTEFIYEPGIQLDLDSLPTPDYTDLSLKTYYQIASVYRSRGCTNRCKFCAEWRLFGPNFRVRSIEKVVDDVEKIIKTYDPKYLIFGESLINDDLEYFEKLCDALIEKKFNIKIGTHFRANITQEIARKAKLAGFDDAWVGFEAFTDNELKEMNKGISVNQNNETIKILANVGINVLAMLVVGFGNAKEEEKNCEKILKTIKFFSARNESKQPLKIQWRPAPAFLVPGSLEYNNNNRMRISPWSPLFVTSSNKNLLGVLKHELSEIPYSFERLMSDESVGWLVKRIQDADRNAGFAIGGIAAHAIKEVLEGRRQKVFSRKNERVGIAAQRLNAM
jgi:radical SAM superfamily enzyme YgiQ (UPF0313 family)